MNARFKARGLFFDSHAVVSELGKVTAKAFRKFGQMVQGRAKASIKHVSWAARPSLPGNPPHDKQGMIPRFLWYSYDARTKSVVIGPTRLMGTAAQRASNAVESLEHGGVSMRRDHRRDKWRRVRIRPRPLMQPALDRTIAAGGMAEAWRKSIKA